MIPLFRDHALMQANEMRLHLKSHDQNGKTGTRFPEGHAQ